VDYPMNFIFKCNGEGGGKSDDRKILLKTPQIHITHKLHNRPDRGNIVRVVEGWWFPRPWTCPLPLRPTPHHPPQLPPPHPPRPPPLTSSRGSWRQNASYDNRDINSLCQLSIHYNILDTKKRLVQKQIYVKLC